MEPVADAATGNQRDRSPPLAAYLTSEEQHTPADEWQVHRLAAMMTVAGSDALSPPATVNMELKDWGLEDSTPAPPPLALCVPFEM